VGTVFALPRNTTGGLGWRKHGPVQRLAAGPYRVCGAVGAGSSGMHALDHRAIRERGGPRRPARRRWLRDVARLDAWPPSVVLGMVRGWRVRGEIRQPGWCDRLLCVGRLRSGPVVAVKNGTDCGGRLTPAVAPEVWSLWGRRTGWGTVRGSGGWAVGADGLWDAVAAQRPCTRRPTRLARGGWTTKCG